MEVSANRLQLVAHNPALQGQAHLSANARFSLTHAHGFGDSVHFGADEDKDAKNTPKTDETSTNTDNKEQNPPKTDQTTDNKPADSTASPATATVEHLKELLQEKGTLKKEDAGDLTKVAEAAVAFIQKEKSTLLVADKSQESASEQLKAAVGNADVSTPEKILEATAKLLQEHKLLDPTKLKAAETPGPLKAFGVFGWGGLIGLLAGGLTLGIPPLGITLLVLGGISTIVGIVKAFKARGNAAAKPTESNDNKTDSTKTE